MVMLLFLFFMTCTVGMQASDDMERSTITPCNTVSDSEDVTEAQALAESFKMARMRDPRTPLGHKHQCRVSKRRRSVTKVSNAREQKRSSIAMEKMRGNILRKDVDAGLAALEAGLRKL